MSVLPFELLNPLKPFCVAVIQDIVILIAGDLLLCYAMVYANLESSQWDCMEASGDSQDLHLLLINHKSQSMNAATL